MMVNQIQRLIMEEWFAEIVRNGSKSFEHGQKSIKELLACPVLSGLKMEFLDNLLKIARIIHLVLNRLAVSLTHHTDP